MLHIHIYTCVIYTHIYNYVCGSYEAGIIFLLDSACLQQYLTFGAALGGRDRVVEPLTHQNQEHSEAEQAAAAVTRRTLGRCTSTCAWRRARARPSGKASAGPREAHRGPRPEPWALDARPGPAQREARERPNRAARSWAGPDAEEPAGPPESVSPGSPQLPVVLLLLAASRLRHGRARPTENRRATTENCHRLLERAGALSAPLPRRLPRAAGEAPPLHCARVACTPGSLRPNLRNGSGDHG